MPTAAPSHKTAILKLARRCPHLSRAEIARQVGCHPSTVARHLPPTGRHQAGGTDSPAARLRNSGDTASSGSSSAEGSGTAVREPAPTLFAKVTRYSGGWEAALQGRSVGLLQASTKADAVRLAEQHMRSSGGGEITVTDRQGAVTSRYIVRAPVRATPLKVTVRHAKRGASVVYGGDPDKALMYGNAIRYRSRAEAESAARHHVNHHGGGEVEIQNAYGTVLRTEPVPAPDWWLFEPSEDTGER